ncbi:MAG: hypothetical protein FJX44_05685 [Alphaproteobacteria bacterium]|nr:hypothetical protein [Alphaproteobacteria bacterium]
MRLLTTRAASWALVAAILMIAPQAMAECLPWKKAGPLIAKNGLVPANQVYETVLARTGGKILHASLCENNGRFVYKFSVLGPKGDVTNHNIDARTGQF